MFAMRRKGVYLLLCTQPPMKGASVFKGRRVLATQRLCVRAPAPTRPTNPQETTCFLDDAKRGRRSNADPPSSEEEWASAAIMLKFGTTRPSFSLSGDREVLFTPVTAVVRSCPRGGTERAHLSRSGVNHGPGTQPVRKQAEEYPVNPGSYKTSDRQSLSVSYRGAKQGPRMHGVHQGLSNCGVHNAMDRICGQGRLMFRRMYSSYVPRIHLDLFSHVNDRSRIKRQRPPLIHIGSRVCHSTVLPPYVEECRAIPSKFQLSQKPKQFGFTELWEKDLFDQHLISLTYSGMDVRVVSGLPIEEIPRIKADLVYLSTDMSIVRMDDKHTVIGVSSVARNEDLDLLLAVGMALQGFGHNPIHCELVANFLGLLNLERHIDFTDVVLFTDSAGGKDIYHSGKVRDPANMLIAQVSADKLHQYNGRVFRGVYRKSLVLADEIAKKARCAKFMGAKGEFGRTVYVRRPGDDDTLVDLADIISKDKDEMEYLHHLVTTKPENLERPAQQMIFEPLSTAQYFDPDIFCGVCCKHAPFILEINTATATVRDFVKKALRKILKMKCPLVMQGARCIYHASDDVDDLGEDGNKILATLSPPVRHGVSLSAHDVKNGVVHEIIIWHREVFDLESSPDGMLLYTWKVKTR